MNLLLVSEDYEGLAASVPLYIERAVEQASPRRRRRAPPANEIPHGHLIWLQHLCELDELLGVAAFQPTLAEAKGIALLRGARDKFWSEHQRHSCGAVNHRHALFCSGCGKTFKRDGGE